MRIHFDHAKQLYHRKLLPMLERTHGLTREELRALPQDDARAAAFQADDRLIKTLLLAALVPEVEALKALTPARLAALNHGSIRTPIAGREGQEVLRRLRGWAAQVGEIKLSDDANPTVSLQLTGVDTESIIEQARNIDNPGNRQRKVREILFHELGVTDSDELFPVHEFEWRGTTRSCEILYTNVRELSDDSLKPRDEETWRVAIDYPFDVDGKTPNDDLARLQDFSATGGQCRTLVWLPAFLSRDSLKDLGTLVILDHILTGERFAGVSAHLSPVDRAQARSLLENQQSQLRQKLKLTLEGAYGIAPAAPGSIDPSHELSEHFQSLDGWQPQPPVGATLGEAFVHFIGQALEQQYPAHPRFEAPVKTSGLRKVWDVVRAAAETPEGRVAVDRQVRSLVRGIAYPLNLGEMGETHFVLRDTWKQRFLQQHAAEGGPLTVAKLRRWTDVPEARGLPEEVQNLLVLTFAWQTGRSFFLHGGPYEVTVESIPDEVELRQQALPQQTEWEQAQRRASAVFGYTASPLLNASNVNRLSEEIKRKASEARSQCRQLVRQLADVGASFGVDGQSNRGRTATSSAALVETLADAPIDRVVSLLAGATIATSESAAAASLAEAGRLAETLQSGNWDLFDALERVTDERRIAAQAIRQRIADALAADEYVVRFAPELRAAQSEAVKLLSQPIVAPPPPPTKPGRRRVEAARAQDLDPGKAKDLFASLQKKLDESTRRRLTVDWIIEEEPPS
jgi:hypothetical protein